VTRDDLFNMVWHAAPATKFLVGRKSMREMVKRIVGSWQVSSLRPSDRDTQASYAASLMFDATASQYSTLWLLLFQALLTFAIQALIEWWFASAEIRTLIIAWQQDIYHERH